MTYSKEALRKEVINKRNASNEVELSQLSLIIQDYILASDLFANAKTLMTYLSYPKEVQTDNIVKNAFVQGKTISIPVCIQKETDLLPCIISDIDQVDIGYFGLREPKKEFRNPIEESKLDLIIVPGVVFDKKGNRIGHGKGYYDNFLSKIPISTPIIGLAYDFQITDKIWDVDSWDVPMRGIITESGWAFKNY